MIESLGKWPSLVILNWPFWLLKVLCNFKVVIEKLHKHNDIFELGPSKTFHKSWGKNDDGLLSDGKKMMTNDRVSWKMASHSDFTFTHEFLLAAINSLRSFIKIQNERRVRSID